MGKMMEIKNLKRCERHLRESRHRGKNFKKWREKNWNEVPSVSLKLMRLNDILNFRTREIQKMFFFFSILSNVSGHMYEFQFTITSRYIL